MKLSRIMRMPVVVSALVLGTRVLQAQETNELELLKRQLRQMQENFDRVQREHKQLIDTVTQKLDELAKRQSAEAEKKKLEQELAAALQKNQPAAATQAASPSAAAAPWSPSQPI